MNRELYILLISSNYFFPPIDGITVRDYNLFKSFSKPFRFDLLTFGDQEVICDQNKLSNQAGPCFENVALLNLFRHSLASFLYRRADKI